MAVREILTVLQSNIDIAATVAAANKLHAGMAIARLADGTADVAGRGVAGQTYVGVSADDASSVGNTMIQIDPVGATGLDSGKFVAENNGYFVAWKRALGDFQNETVNNLNNLTDVNSGFGTPRRGIGYYSTPSTQLIVDTIRTDCSTSSATLDGGAAPGASLAPNALLVEGGVSAGSYDHSGYFVYTAQTDGSHGKARARVDKYFGAGQMSNTGFAQITLL